MARTSNIFARVEPELKDQAEAILNQLGIPMSNAVSMFLNQVVLQRGIPFEVKLPADAPLSYGALSKEQFDSEIGKSMQSVKDGKGYSAESIAEEMRKDFGV